MNNPAKQEDIYHWHKESGSLISIVTETKLCSGLQPWIMKRFESVQVFMSGLDVGFRGAGVAIFVNDSLARHVFKVEKVKGRVFSICLLFKNKLSVSVIGLYASVINSFIADTVNRSSFVVLDGDFNEDNSVKGASLRKCLGLGLVNVFGGHSLARISTWNNSRGVSKVLDYILVSNSLISVVVDRNVSSVLEFFDMDYLAKFKIKNADEKKWAHFKDLSECVLLGSLDRFKMAEDGGNLDGMWGMLADAMTDDTLGFDRLADIWLKVDPSKASKVFSMIRDGVGSAGLISHLSKVAKKSAIRDAIDKHMGKFEMDKDEMIWSILERLFHKVILDYLVVAQQYALLVHVNDSTFSLVMCDITMCKMSSVISNLPNGKAAGLSGITNELWKHTGCLVLECLLSLLNSCLRFSNVPVHWKEVWTARKILSKVLSDRISLACSRFDVFRGNNFSVLKGTSTQSPISAVGSIVEDALEKGCELWLVLQDMHKAYDSVGWSHLEASLCHIKMCSKFIKFFGNIHNSHFNRVMTDFGLSDGYKVLDGLGIFYDPLLCEVARQDHLCGYRINLNFVSKTGRIETSGGMTSFFAAGAFVDNTIWVGNGQASTQHILNVASKFFFINNININNKKTVAISINKRVGVSVLSINGQAITVANLGVSHRYLGIFLFTNGLSKPSLTKANSDIKFFSNMVLQKAVSDKQFSYLVSAVLQPIVSYRMQFSFVSKAVCLKWDVLIRRGLKSKANLPRDFFNEMLHHPSLYGLKSFEQLQAEYKTASIVLCWALLNPLQYSVKLRVNTSNNFLVGVVHIFLDNKLSLDNRLSCAFRSPGHFPMSLVLGDPLYFSVVCSLKIAGVAYDDQLLDKNGSIASAYLNNCLYAPPPAGLASVCASVLDSTSFADIYEEIHGLWANEIDVYTDSSLRNLGMFQVVCGAAVYFLGLNKDLGVEVHGVLSLTLAELQAVALALECVPVSVLVTLHMDNQAAIDACVAELGLLQPDCRNSCWIERCHVVNLIKFKDLTVRWIKIKGHAGIAGNVLANVLAKQAVHSGISLSARINCRYVVADGKPISSNARHFVRDIFRSICKFQLEVGSGQGIVSCLFGLVVNWNSTALVWHPDSHMLSETVHFRLPVAVQKRLYNKDYPGVSCLFCGNVELPDYGFTCVKDAFVRSDILGDFGDLSLGVSNVKLYSVFCKRFVLKSWMDETTASLGGKKKAVIVVFRSDMERNGLIGDDVVVVGALGVGALPLSAGTVYLIGVLNSLDVGFSFRSRFLFLSGAVYRVSVLISA
ncbi:hypothetical protein G9A89_007143 [Geosiphon pyriformis]|nr:hypothetical protein G9A89_007143 [Geosiphon pyriformis]